MRRELSDQEYRELLGVYSVSHFMGGISGPDQTKIIFLHSNKIELVDADDFVTIEEIHEIQRREVEEYLSQPTNRNFQILDI